MSKATNIGKGHGGREVPRAGCKASAPLREQVPHPQRESTYDGYTRIFLAAMCMLNCCAQATQGASARLGRRRAAGAKRY
eukprot:974841-Alexandrium_andersonii.AAC.1